MRSMQQDMSSEAEQLVVAMKQFAEVYNTQIHSWTNQPQPELSGVGPAAERVHSVYQNITKVRTNSKSKANLARNNFVFILTFVC